ncbi:cupredoxin domain-containing protein [Natronococcus sp.]|uniref:cupredoxin domain-containing protein n=1 Tax=Natronococcus sp. TaxID=35747 RepID=UPI003A4D6CFC
MEHQERLSRRRTLRLVGGTATAVLAAGCLGSSETGDEAERADDGDDGAGDGDGDSAPEDESRSGESDDESDTTEPDATDGDGKRGTRDATEAWTDVEEIALSATTAGWEGVEPEPIAGEENPALVLTAGREYVLSWTNEDGNPHNVEIWDESGEVVDDYETELMDEAGATQSLEFEASAEMAEYVCEIHAGWQKRGRIGIERP